MGRHGEMGFLRLFWNMQVASVLIQWNLSLCFFPDRSDLGFEQAASSVSV